jgi:hypothetical protein
MKITIPRFCVQKPPQIEMVEESMMHLYIAMTQKYLKERQLIPNGNLIQVRYEDFITKPFQEIKKIYEMLQLKGFQDAEASFDSYIRTQWNMKKDQYAFDEESKKKIEKKWGFALKEFGYETPHF